MMSKWPHFSWSFQLIAVILQTTNHAHNTGHYTMRLSMKRTILHCVLSGLLISILPLTASGYDFEVDGIYYNVKDGEAEVTCNGTRCYSGDIVIPESVTHEDTVYQVTGIGSKAFIDCPGLTSIVFPGNLRRIGNDAFYQCRSITTVIIPDSVTTIGAGAFSYCFALDSLSIGQSVTSIGDNAFCGSALTELNLPDAVRSIGKSAFFSCTNLARVTIPNGVTTIGEGAFQKCTALTSLTIPESVTNIGSGAFTYDSKLKSLVFNAANCKLNGGIFGSCPIDTITLGNHVKRVPDYLAYGLSSLRSITIPEHVTFLGPYLFFKCSSLETINMQPLTPPVTSNITDHPFIVKVYVPGAAYKAYCKAPGWKDLILKNRIGQ